MRIAPVTPPHLPLDKGGSVGLMKPRRSTEFYVIIFTLNVRKMEGFMDMLKTFEEKISFAVEKIKILKDEKNNLDKRIEELENLLRIKEQEVDRLAVEKAAIKTQIENLFNELDSIEVRNNGK